MISTGILIGIVVGIFFAASVAIIASSAYVQYVPTVFAEEDKKSMFSMMGSNMGSMTSMCQTMMASIPKDVIIKATSGQLAKVGKESKITLLVLDKKTNRPLNNVDVFLHIEEGAPMAAMNKMTMMDMMERMFEAENIGSGKYLVEFTPTTKGYYTMHTHVIPAGKSMMSMMNNHMDIGIIAK